MSHDKLFRHWTSLQERKLEYMANKYKLNDEVEVKIGKEKGKRAKIVRINLRGNCAYLDGVNLKIKHVKSDNPPLGKRIDLTAPINLSNLSLVCPNCSQSQSRVKFRTDYYLNDKGKKKSREYRVCRECGKDIIYDKENKS